MQDNDYLLLEGQTENIVSHESTHTVVVGTPEQAVAIVSNEVTINVNTPHIHVVTVGPCGGGSGSAVGAVFVLDVTASSTGIVADKDYDPDTVPANVVVQSCASDTTNVRVHVGGEGGGNNYSPVITVNGITATLTESSTKRWFTGYADIVLPAGNNTVAIASDSGGAATVDIFVAGAGPNVLSVTFGPYPGVQTELKAGDTISVTITTEPEADSVSILAGAVNATTFAVSGGTATGTLTISSASGSIGIQVKAKNSFGTFGNIFVSTPLNLNQTYPTIGSFSVTYPPTQSGLDVAEQGAVSCVVSNFDTISYTSPDLIIASPTVYETPKTVTNNRTGYVGSGTNYTITANRAANNATSTASTLVVIATIPPTAYISQVPTGRMTSSPAGISYEIRIHPNQTVTAPSLTAPVGTWLGSWINAGSYWRRNLLITDSMARGAYNFTDLSITGPTNIVGTTITSGSAYIIGGFSSRSVTFAAFSRVAYLGVQVADATKMTASIGAQTLTRYTDNGVRAGGFYPANVDGSYNATGTYIGLSDTAFAGSNTTGSLVATVQESA